MKSPLPDGCKFFIYPDYRIEYKGRIIFLGRYQAEILLILMSKPNRIFTVKEIASKLYDEREDGGPYWRKQCITRHMFDLRSKFTARGMMLNLKADHKHYGYVYSPSSISFLKTVDQAVPNNGNWTFMPRRGPYDAKFFIPKADPDEWALPIRIEDRLMTHYWPARRLRRGR